MWPDNERAYGVFQQVGTRWRFPAMGSVPYGLDWPAIYPILDRLGLSNDEREELERELMVMERSATETMREFAPKPTKA